MNCAATSIRVCGACASRAASERQLDGVILAFAGLSRLWQDEAVGAAAVLRELLAGLPRMLLPLTLCPAAPAQGALAIECRTDDARTRAILAAIDDAATRAAINAERALLAQRGGGCHQRFGATQVQVGGLGPLLYVREADEQGAGAPQLRWALPPAPLRPLRPWDGSVQPGPELATVEGAAAECAARLAASGAAFIAHRRALPELAAAVVNRCRHIWVSGTESWFALAARGVWVEGCAEALGFAALRPTIESPLLALPPAQQWLALTNVEASGWLGRGAGARDLPPRAAGRADAGRRAAGLVAQWCAVRTWPRRGGGGLSPRLRARQDRRGTAARGHHGVHRVSFRPALAGLAAHVNIKAGQGSLSVMPARRARLIAALAALWIVLVLVLGAGWVALVITQAHQISELQSFAGSTDSAVAAQWASTRRRVVGESAVFLLLLLAVSALLAWLYWRENRRARGMQAFFAAVTHELRTPLTSIRLQAEAIAEGDQRAELARRLLEDSHRLESQIDKTLELARIEGGGPLAEQSVPLRDWLERTLTAIAAAHGARLELSVGLDQPLPPILADAAALQMILRNLVENSVRHAQLERVQLRVGARVRGEQVVIEYRDNGVGSAVRGAELGRLFGRGAGSGGSGVGLYLVRALMQRMGGRAEFHSSPGNGFRAELYFAANREAAAS